MPGARLAVLLLLGFGCAGAEPPAHLADVLTADPAKVDFGVVPAGQTKTISVQLTNRGTQQLHFDAPIISQAANAFSGAGFPVQLMPNETLAGQVSYDAQTLAGHQTATLELFAHEFTDNLLVPMQADAGS